jgi:hypothetical protein
MSSPFPLVPTPQIEPVLPSCLPFLKKDIFVHLRYLYREFHYDISITICIVSWMSSTLHFQLLWIEEWVMLFEKYL